MVDPVMATFHSDNLFQKHLSTIFVDAHGHISYFNVAHCYDADFKKTIKCQIGRSAFNSSSRWDHIGALVKDLLITDLVEEVMTFLDMEVDDFKVVEGALTISPKISPMDEKCCCLTRGNWAIYNHRMLEPQVFIIECIVVKEEEKIRETAMDWSGGCHDCGLWSIGDEFSKASMPKDHVTRKRYWNSPLKFRFKEDPIKWQPEFTSWRKPQVLVKFFSSQKSYAQVKELM